MPLNHHHGRSPLQTAVYTGFLNTGGTDRFTVVTGKIGPDRWLFRLISTDSVKNFKFKFKKVKF